MSWFSAARTRLHLLIARRAAESRIDEEVRFHIEMETSRLVRDERLVPEEARRRALANFGGVTQHSETLREGRGLGWLSGLSLDMKLGGRMLAKYPGITLVGGVAMAFAIWFGSVVFEMLGLFLYPKLPLPGGARIVQVFNWDTKENTPEKRAMYDFVAWRDEVRMIVDLGAWRDVARNIAVPGGETRQVLIAEMSASGFAVSSAKPLFGRTLHAGDERGDAPAVVVLGYEVWRDRFGSDPAILGKSVKIGDSFASVVGVMGEGYAWPIAHEAWMPLRVEQLDRAPRSGLPITVFGRLADGASFKEAQAELDVLGRRMATQFATTHEHIRPRVIPYVDDDDPSNETFTMTVGINVMVIALLVLICGNIALLLFARAATRETELTVRSALGASRVRLVMQLFAEALVLGGVAAAVGLGAAAITLRLYARHYLEVNYDTLPFWFITELSLPTVVYAIGLTLVGAVISGVLPALKVTRGISAQLRQGTAGSGLRFSGVWTFVIVAQVAATVLLPAIVALEQNEISRVETYDAGFPLREYLAINVETDVPPEMTSAAREAWQSRAGVALQTLRQRLASQPGVRGVTFVTEPPSTSHAGARIQLADSVQIPTGLRVVSIARADLNYFEVLGAPIISGRGFHSGDLVPGARNVIVDLGFVKHVLGGVNPLGRHVRIGRADSSWWEIVGVVKDLGMGSPIERSPAAGIYKVATPETMGSPSMMIHATGDAQALTPRLRAIAEAVDPNIRLNDITRMDLMADPMVWFLTLWRQITTVLTGIAVLLSLAGIYAVLSFAVSKRTREIGVRVALGASPRRIMATIFRRPLTQVGTGILVGSFLVGLGSVVVRNHQPDTAMGMHTLEGGLSLGQLATLIGYAALMLGVCLLACIVPTRRALGVQPTEALREQ
jgi:putative ABC transport system permease protein